MADRAWQSTDQHDRIDRVHREQRAKASLADGYVGPRLAGADTPFERGREPIQTLKRLMDARNALVHLGRARRLRSPTSS